MVHFEIRLRTMKKTHFFKLYYVFLNVQWPVVNLDFEKWKKLIWNDSDSLSPPPGNIMLFESHTWVFGELQGRIHEMNSNKNKQKTRTCTILHTWTYLDWTSIFLTIFSRFIICFRAWHFMVGSPADTLAFSAVSRWWQVYVVASSSTATKLFELLNSSIESV